MSFVVPMSGVATLLPALQPSNVNDNDLADWHRSIVQSLDPKHTDIRNAGKNFLSNRAKQILRLQRVQQMESVATANHYGFRLRNGLVHVRTFVQSFDRELGEGFLN